MIKQERLEKKLYIYFLNVLTDYYKIGITTNIKRRLESLNTANPTHIKLCYYKKMRFAKKMELYIKNKYKNYIIKNEWFCLSEEMAKKIIKDISKGKIGMYEYQKKLIG